jgi:hypothetical protein
MTKKSKKNLAKDESSVGLLIEDFFSYENLVHKRQT